MRVISPTHRVLGLQKLWSAWYLRQNLIVYDSVGGEKHKNRLQ